MRLRILRTRSDVLVLADNFVGPVIFRSPIMNISVYVCDYDEMDTNAAREGR